MPLHHEGIREKCERAIGFNELLLHFLLIYLRPDNLYFSVREKINVCYNYNLDEITPLSQTYLHDLNLLYKTLWKTTILVIIFWQKLNVDNSCQKTRKIRYYIFGVLPNFIVSLYFVSNVLSRIAVLQIFIR